MKELSKRWIYGGRGRGRPNRRSVSEILLYSTILIARKRGLDPKLLIEAFVEAWSNETSDYGSLKITRRAVTPDSATFLITSEGKVVSQLSLNLQVLNNPEHFKDQIQEFPPFHPASEKLDQKQKKIGELRYGMKGIDVEGKITEITPTLLVHTRFGSEAYVSNVTVADETGSIKLSLWNERIGQVRVGDEVELKDCKVASYRGELQLRLIKKSRILIKKRIGQNGKLEHHEEGED